MNAVVKFNQMKDGDQEDYDLVIPLEEQYARDVASRLIAALRGLEGSFSGHKISRLAHSLQTASRAWCAGADDDWVVSALLHDIGDVLAPHNHDKYAASILQPYVREQCTWVVSHHADFQLFYYGHFIGVDRNRRDRHRDSVYYDDCVRFCEEWDQSSFDPAYSSFPLDFFEPVVTRVFARHPGELDIVRPGERIALADRATAAQRAGSKAS